MQKAINSEKNSQNEFQRVYARTLKRVQRSIIKHYKKTNKLSDSFSLLKEEVIKDNVSFTCSGFTFNHYDLFIIFNCNLRGKNKVIIEYDITIDK